MEILHLILTNLGSIAVIFSAFAIIIRGYKNNKKKDKKHYKETLEYHLNNGKIAKIEKKVDMMEKNLKEIKKLVIKKLAKKEGK